MDWVPATWRGRLTLGALIVGFVGFEVLVAWYFAETGRSELNDHRPRVGSSSLMIGAIVYWGLVGFVGALWFFVRHGGLPVADDDPT